MADLTKIARDLHIGEYRRHVFLCTGDSCCSGDDGEDSWKALKDQLKERNLSLSSDPNACFRTKVGCLRVCKNGPILLVYPEGTWYSRMTEDKIPRLIEEHLIGGKPIEEWVFARNPLGDDEAV